MMSKPCIGLGGAWQYRRCTNQYKQRSAHGPCICPCLHLLRSLWWHWRLPNLPRSGPLMQKSLWCGQQNRLTEPIDTYKVQKHQNLMFASTAGNKMHKNKSERKARPQKHKGQTANRHPKLQKAKGMPNI